MTYRPPPTRLSRWKRTFTEPQGDYRIFRVERHDLEDATGAPRRSAFTIVCSDWCNVIAVTPDEEIVLIWQYRFGSDSITLEIPGGVIDAGEAPMAAALRELEEETGYRADAIAPLATVEPNPAIQANRCHTFVATGARKTSVTKFDESEECEVVLVPVADLPRLLDGGHVTHSLAAYALETFLRRHVHAPAGRS